MEHRKTTVQKLISPGSPLNRALKYVGVISVLNNLSLPPMEINILAFILTHNGIGGELKTQFCSLFSTTPLSVNNTIGVLKKKGLLSGSRGNIKAPKVLSLDFNSNIILQIKLFNEEETT